MCVLPPSLRYSRKFFLLLSFICSCFFWVYLLKGIILNVYHVYLWLRFQSLTNEKLQKNRFERFNQATTQHAHSFYTSSVASLRAGQWSTGELRPERIERCPRTWKWKERTIRKISKVLSKKKKNPLENSIEHNILIFETTKFPIFVPFIMKWNKERNERDKGNG